MSLPRFNPRTVVLLLMILITGILRVLIISENTLSPLSNFSCIGAMALFGGASFNKGWKAFAFPLLTLLISDLILSFTVLSPFRNGFLYGGWYWIYGAFALMTLAGRLLIKQVTVPSVLLSSVVCVLIHWIVADIGVWMASKLYAKTITGFIECLIAAIPYEWNFLAGTVVYSTILFGSYEWMQRKYFMHQPAKV